MEKINFQNNITKLNKTTMDTFQSNIENAIDEVDNRFNYSTEEQKIGTWIDGKPLYMKTIVYTSGWTIGGEVSLTHGIANLRSDGTTQFIPTIHADMQKWASGIFDFSSTAFSIYIGTLDNNFTINKLIIILEYTKTTD